jgi:hypothetical protein
MTKHALEIAVAAITFNQKGKRRKTKYLSINDLIQDQTCCPRVAIPHGNDGIYLDKYGIRKPEVCHSL